MFTKYFSFFLFTLIPFSTYGQENVEKYLKDLIDVSQMQLSTLPVTAKILSHTSSKENTILHVYLQQTINTKPVENAIASLHYNEGGKLIYHTNKFIALPQPIKVASHSELTGLLQRVKSNGYLADDIEVERTVNGDIHILKSGLTSFTVKECYSMSETGELLPVFVVTLPVEDEYFIFFFHGQTYNLIEKKSAEHSCNHLLSSGLNTNCTTFNSKKDVDIKQSFPTRGNSNNATYLVLPYPYENPLQSDISVIEESINIASPNGWHDGNGMIGQYFNVTKGNNVHAYNDRSNTSFPLGDEPYSVTRNFVDYNSDINSEPEEIIELNTVQMFYSVNYLHDLLYRVGFDEESGNFQLFNYSGAPGQADEVRAMVQVDGEDKSTLNEASFFTDIDGIKPRLKVSLFSAGNNPEFNIYSPSDISGFYRTAAANFGVEIRDAGIEGKVVLARAGENFPPFLGCSPFENSIEMAGNIALIDRGDCQFRDKVSRAENAGAIAAIICNFEDAVISMGGGGTLHNPGIPSVMIQSSVCREIKLKLLNKEEVVIKIKTLPYEGPAFIDGSMDNGVIAHEFMHGVTDRLIGGRLNSNCLFNAESMAEGWSDFLALALTFREEGMVSGTPRGIASYLAQQQAQGFGIRRFPYNVSEENDLTYADITGAVTTHQTGEIWATVLWEIFWKFIEKYGADETYENENAGNFKALYLVVEALKLTACEPGFIDARNGILAADQILFAGQNTCILWEIFAKRGLGNKASQGSSYDRNDGLADYSMPASCILPIYIEKNMPELFSIHSSNKVNLKVQNTSDIIFEKIGIMDTLPPGFSVTDMQPLLPYAVTDDILHIEITDFQPGETLEISYTLVAGPETEPSISILFDPAETQGSGWSVFNLFGDLNWEITHFDPYEGNSSWNAFFSFGSSNHFLNWEPVIPANTRNPFLRFFHKYDNPPGISGGTVSISEDGGETFTEAGKEILKSTYPARINPRVFSQSKLGGYTGDSKEYQMALVDLRSKNTDNIRILWKFGTFNTTSPVERTGWTIDNIEILDGVYYDLGISVINVNNLSIIASLPKSSNGGMLIDTTLPTSQIPKNARKKIYTIYPNPAEGYFTVEFPENNIPYVTLNLIDSKGNPVQTKILKNLYGKSSVLWNTHGLTPGIYLLQIISDSDMVTKKVILR